LIYMWCLFPCRYWRMCECGWCRAVLIRDWEMCKHSRFISMWLRWRLPAAKWQVWTKEEMWVIKTEYS